MNRFNLPIVTLSLASVLLVACGSSQTQVKSNSQASSTAETQTSEDIRFTRLMDLAKKEVSKKIAINYYFEAALIKYKTGDNQSALDILENNVIPYQHPQRFNAYVLISDIQMKNSQPFFALDALSSAKNLSEADLLENQIIIGQKSAAALESLGNWPEGIKTRIELSPILPAELIDENEQKLWESIQNLTDSEIALLQEDSGIILDGWLYISTILRSKTDTLNTQRIKYDQWRTSTPYHPAALNPPEDFNVLTDLDKIKLNNIGIALPMTGSLSAVSQAIIDGFLAAYYSENSKNKPKLTFIDANEHQSVDFLLEKIESEAVDIIIGPLTKKLVAQLTTRELNVPVIALNQLEKPEYKENLYHFSLSSKDDIRELILFAKQEGATRAAILGVNEAWAIRQAEEFKKIAMQEGIEILDSIAYENKPSERATAVKKLLLVNESQQRKHAIQQLIDLPVDSIDRSRLDLDYVYFIGHLDDAKQIRPSLDFYFANEIPMLASNTINNTALDSKAKAQDVERILFTEVPALIKRDPVLRRIENKVSGNILKRLQAMGADAYMLANRSWIFHKLPHAKMSANTGLLTMDNNGIFHKRPELVFYQSGKLINAQDRDVIIFKETKAIQ